MTRGGRTRSPARRQPPRREGPTLVGERYEVRTGAVAHGGHVVARLPAPLGKGAVAAAIKRLKIADEDDLMVAIARRRVDDTRLIEALMPGAAGGDVAIKPLPQRAASAEAAH